MEQASSGLHSVALVQIMQKDVAYLSLYLALWPTYLNPAKARADVTTLYNLVGL